VRLVRKPQVFARLVIVPVLLIAPQRWLYMRLIDVFVFVPLTGLCCSYLAPRVNPGPAANAASLEAAYRSHHQNLEKQDPDGLVHALREFPAALPASGPSNGQLDPIETRRLAIYQELSRLGPEATPALSRGLRGAPGRCRRPAMCRVFRVIRGR
jgi:hypothetical protein